MGMRGSVLIVVLGLLAILAILGVALLTMSTVDRQTSNSFAIQTQFQLAADGAVDYACHQVVDDLWDFSITAGSGYLTAPGSAAPGGYVTLLTGPTDSTEPYDYAKPAADSGAVADAWLSGPITSDSQPPDPVSCRDTASTRRFGLDMGITPASGDGPNNLALPGATSGYYDGVWVPDLTMAFEAGVIRISLTILDHGGMLNLNAHGNRPGGAWEEADAAGFGFFISDVDPLVPGPAALLTGTWGRWGADSKPGIRFTGETLIERPVQPDGTKDYPFTLDEEWELRRLCGTYFQSRLERIWPGLKTDPGLTTPPQCWQNRLLYTTVGWTSEVRGDKGASRHLVDPLDSTGRSLYNLPAWTLKDPSDTRRGRSARKIDLNLDTAQHLYDALKDSGIIPAGDNLGQFVANIEAFRDLDNTFEAITLSANSDAPTGLKTTYVGAERQPFFSEITARLVEERQDPGDPNSPVIKETWTIQLELYNPWPSDSYGLPNGNPASATGLDIGQMTVEVAADAAASTDPTPVPTPRVMKYNDCKYSNDTQAVWKRVVEVNKDPAAGPVAFLKDKFRSAKLSVSVGGTAYTLDQITNDQVITLDGQARGAGGTGRLFRTFGIEWEKRGNADTMPTPVIFVYPWQADSNAGDPGIPPPVTMSGNAGIPIRIMNCVRETYNASTEGPLPLRKGAGDSPYKAFARVGELNRVLCATGLTANDWWTTPWVTRVTTSAETSVKFDWRTYPRAANVYCVGGPWADKIDNDADGLVDDADKGDKDARGHAGPEFRVAGKINLNTARPETLEGLLAGVGIPSGARAAVKNAILTPKGAGGLRPMESIAEILTSASVTGAFASGNLDDARGALELRDLVFTRLSNIATCRSDTFSIYGTVQFINPNIAPSGRPRVLKTRRFWALVDRSPSLAFVASCQYGIHPRVLNFQWLD
jgi:hypothetical protein